LLPDFRAKPVEPIVLPKRKGLKMATITTRNKTNGKPSFTAQVRIKKGGKVIFSKSETFSQRKLAEKWATGTEKAWHEGIILQAPQADTFAELIKRYRLDVENEVGKTMIQCLRTLEGMDETNVGCQEVDPTFLVDLARALKRAGRCAATVNNYMQHLYGLFAVAETAYKIPLKYEDMQGAMRTLRRLKIVGKANTRDRRPTLEELNTLMEEAYARSTRSNAAPLHKIIAFAIASSRRLSEITRIRWADMVILPMVKGMRT
jgi:integrase